MHKERGTSVAIILVTEERGLALREGPETGIGSYSSRVAHRPSKGVSV
jgi:hypothetical protein